MTTTILRTRRQLHLRPFEPADGAEIARWVETDEELRWLAPSTRRPLTAEKVLCWKKPGGYAFVSIRDSDPHPIGYGELNPLRAHVDHLWLGHVIVRPDQRGRGAGQALVRRLTDHAFERLSARRISLIVFPDNTAALRCYLRVGFAVAGAEYHRFGPTGRKQRLLRLQINAPLR